MKYKIVLSNTRFKPSFMSRNFPDLHVQISLVYPIQDSKPQIVRIPPTNRAQIRQGKFQRLVYDFVEYLNALNKSIKRLRAFSNVLMLFATYIFILGSILVVIQGLHLFLSYQILCLSNYYF